MLKVDSSLNHIPAGRNHVIGLHESINQPLVNIPSFGTAPTAAYVLGTRNDQGAYTVFVYLHQAETRAVVIYVSEPRHLTHDQYRVEEADALRFVESMGFMVDNLHFPTLAPPEQETVMERVPLFRPPLQTLDLYDVQDDQSAGPPPPAIFGGLSAEDNALFRGPGPGTATGTPVLGTPDTPPAGGIPAMALRHSALSPGASTPPASPTATQDNPPTDAAVPMATNGHIAPAIQSDAGGSTIPPGFVSISPGDRTNAGIVQPNVPTPSPTPSNLDLSPAVSRSEPDSAALQRLGRLLGTFMWVLAASTAAVGCKSSSSSGPPPQAVLAKVDLGNQHLSQGQWPDAIKTFSDALEEDESNFDALRGTALAYLKLGRLEDAERFYKKSLEANPKSSLSRNELAVVMMEQGRCQEAVPLFEKVLEDIFYPTPEFAEHNLAQAYACLGRTDEALSRLDKLVTKRPYFCLGYLTLSRLASKSRRPESTIRACDDFAHYCEQNEKIKNQVLPQQSAMCYLRKGLAYAELGDVESARTAFERCQSLGEVGRECSKSLELLPR